MGGVFIYVLEAACCAWLYYYYYSSKDMSKWLPSLSSIIFGRDEAEAETTTTTTTSDTDESGDTESGGVEAEHREQYKKEIGECIRHVKINLFNAEWNVYEGKMPILERNIRAILQRMMDSLEETVIQKLHPPYYRIIFHTWYIFPEVFYDKETNISDNLAIVHKASDEVVGNTDRGQAKKQEVWYHAYDNDDVDEGVRKIASGGYWFIKIRMFNNILLSRHEVDDPTSKASHVIALQLSFHMDRAKLSQALAAASSAGGALDVSSLIAAPGEGSVDFFTYVRSPFFSRGLFAGCLTGAAGLGLGQLAWSWMTTTMRGGRRRRRW